MSEQKFPSEVIDLPSKGVFYPENSPLHSGQIELKYMTAKEEDILTSSNLAAKGLIFDKLYESLILTPGVDIKDLLAGDIDAIMVASRILGYGKEYPVNINCDVCNETQLVVADLTQLNDKEFDESAATRVGDLFETLLPVSKKKVTFKLLTRGDENFIQKEVEGYKKVNLDVIPSTAIFFSKIITAIDGVSDKKAISEFAESMLVNDSRHLKKVYEKCNPGVDFTVEYYCETCEATRKERLPMGLSFFWPEL